MRYSELSIAKSREVMNIENAEITSVSLNFKNHGVLVLDLLLKFKGSGCTYGGYVLGKGYLGAETFTGSSAGLEAIMRIMDVVGVEDLSDLKGKFVRTVTTGWGGQVKAIGNIISDKWFSYEDFFKEDTK